MVSVLLQPPMQYASQCRYEGQKGILHSFLLKRCYYPSKHCSFDHVPDAWYKARPIICNRSSLPVFQHSQRQSSCSPPSHPQVHSKICTPATAPNEVFCFRSHSQDQFLNIDPAPQSKDHMGYSDHLPQ